jgi:UDP-3-O-[3-hydroxymyristoyl] glucosamine N-acyltransferase
MATLGELAELVGGTVRGDETVAIHNAATLRWAQQGEITLVENARYLRQLAQSRATACVASKTLMDNPLLDRPAILVDDPVAAFHRILVHLRPLPCSTQQGISSQAWIHPAADVHPQATVYPGAWIDHAVRVGAGTVIHSGCRIMAGTVIGEHCILFPNVVVYEGTRIGNRVIIHANAVIGAYGFGYTLRDGRYQLSPQDGYVEIQDDVEIGACSTIDRGTFDATVIGEGTKIDNQVMIAHNCHIGRHNLLCSQVGIAGSCTTGDYVIMAGQVGVRDHVDIGEGARLGAQAGVASSIPAGETYLGAPARPEREERQILVSMIKVPAMRKQLKQLERHVAQIAAQLGMHLESEPDDRCSDAA